MDIRLFKNGLGVKKAFDTEYLYKETHDQWKYAMFGTFDDGKLTVSSESIYLVTRDILQAKQTNLTRQLVWGSGETIADELKHVTAFLTEIN